MKVEKFIKIFKGKHRDNRVAKKKAVCISSIKQILALKQDKVSSLVSPYIKGYANSIFFRLKGHSFMKK